jgi:hypothetical protein
MLAAAGASLRYGGADTIEVVDAGSGIGAIGKLTVGRADGAVAVLLAGTLVRYFPNLDRRVVAPLARRGHTVDVYLSLSVAGFGSWQFAGNHFVMHPAYQGMSLDVVKSMIVDGIRDSGGNVGVIRMPAQVNLTRTGEQFKRNGKWWSQELHANSEHARENVAKMYQELDGLWTLAKEAEVKTNESYKFVMIFRDDANWLFDFDLDRLLRTGGEVRLDGKAGRAFGLKREVFQGKRSKRAPRVLCDFAVVAEREVAEPFGHFYRLMTDPGSMGVHLQAEGKHSSENYLYQVVKAFDIRWEQVPNALIPFVRSGRLNISGSTVLCQHKPLDLSFGGVPRMGADILIPNECKSLHHQYHEARS